MVGNHELMNIMGDLPYVTQRTMPALPMLIPRSRKSAYKDYVKWRESHTAASVRASQLLELIEAEWMARHPAGFIEQREAFSLKGSYGKWLRGHAALAEINGVIFLHGGISPSLASLRLRSIPTSATRSLGPAR